MVKPIKIISKELSLDSVIKKTFQELDEILNFIGEILTALTRDPSRKYRIDLELKRADYFAKYILKIVQKEKKLDQILVRFSKESHEYFSRNVLFEGQKEVKLDELMMLTSVRLSAMLNDMRLSYERGDSAKSLLPNVSEARELLDSLKKEVNKHSAILRKMLTQIAPPK
jgi:hypothetical protein